jgi:hypothetical protein
VKWTRDTTAYIVAFILVILLAVAFNYGFS